MIVGASIIIQWCVWIVIVAMTVEASGIYTISRIWKKNVWTMTFPGIGTGMLNNHVDGRPKILRIETIS